MRLNILKRRWQRRLARVLVSLIALILILGFIINLYWSPILAKTFKNSVLKSTDSLYTVNFTDADLHVLQGKVVVYNLDLVPNIKLFKYRRSLHQAPNNLYRLHIKKLVLYHIHPFSLYFRRVLNIGEVVLSAPDLHVEYNYNHHLDTTMKYPQTLYQRIAKTFKFVYIGHIAINDVKFKYEDHSGNKVAISQLQEMNLSASELLIDSTTQYELPGRFLYCKDISAELNNFSGKTLNGLYQYNMKQLRFSSRASRLNAEDIRLTPVSPDEFFKKTHRDRFTVRIDSLQLNSFDFLNYHKYRIFHAKSMEISKGSIGVFSNPLRKTHADSTGKVKIDKSGTFPNSVIFKMNADIKLDTIMFNHLNIAYTEFNAKSHKVGTAAFTNSRGRLLNLTTNRSAIKKDSICALSITTWFMNRGKLDVDFKFDLSDTTKLKYGYSGHMEPMNLAVVNPALMPLAMVKINSGKLNSFDFDINGDVKHAKGRVAVLYNDLKVTLLKPDTIQEKLKRMTIASLFANIFILKHDNPDAAGKPARFYMVDFKRDKDFTFFKTIWKTLLTGIRQCVGYSEQTEKNVKSQMAVRANDKREHKEIKAERKEQRELKKQEKEKAAKAE